jgi:hypothetical protein
MSPLPFSKRNRYAGTPKEITIREDAPETLRYFVLEIVIDLGWGPSSLRDALCRVLHTPPDPSNWSEYPQHLGRGANADVRMLVVPRVRFHRVTARENAQERSTQRHD